jgi:hypothetical protein
MSLALLEDAAELVGCGVLFVAEGAQVDDVALIPLDGNPWVLNPDLLVEMKDNSIGEESRHSRPDYNRPGALCLSDWYTNSRGRRGLVEHDNPATRAPVLELARTSRISTELWDEYEVY